METSKPKKKISEEFGLRETLETFKAGPFPKSEDVLCHLYFHLWSMKKPESDLACLSTTDSLLSLWAPSYLLLMTRQNAEANERFRALLEGSRKKWKTIPEKKLKFLEELKTRFDVSVKGALDIIAADKLFLKMDP